MSNDWTFLTDSQSKVCVLKIFVNLSMNVPIKRFLYIYIKKRLYTAGMSFLLRTFQYFCLLNPIVNLLIQTLIFLRDDLELGRPVTVCKLAEREGQLSTCYILLSLNCLVCPAEHGFSF